MTEFEKGLFVKIVKFLGEVLGETYEIVFHEIDEQKGSSICAIANNHISHRTISSPLSDLALDMIKDKVYEKEDYLIGYKAITKQGKETQGSTFFIKKNNKIIGMLCINHDMHIYKETAEKILKLGNIFNVSIEGEQEKSNSKNQVLPTETVEYLSESIEDTISSIIEPSLLHDDAILRPEKKQEIINALYEKGVFNIKGAVLNVAKMLNMSEQSVYRYLKKVNI